MPQREKPGLGQGLGQGLGEGEISIVQPDRFTQSHFLLNHQPLIQEHWGLRWGVNGYQELNPQKNAPLGATGDVCLDTPILGQQKSNWVFTIRIQPICEDSRCQIHDVGTSRPPLQSACFVPSCLQEPSFTILINIDRVSTNTAQFNNVLSVIPLQECERIRLRRSASAQSSSSQWH